MITVVEIVVGLLIYVAIAKWRKKQEEKREDQEYASELSRNWERHPWMYVSVRFRPSCAEGMQLLGAPLF